MLYLVVEKENNYYYNPSGRLPLPTLLSREAPPPNTIISPDFHSKEVFYAKDGYLC
jgi:hypothetical protein